MDRWRIVLPTAHYDMSTVCVSAVHAPAASKGKNTISLLDHTLFLTFTRVVILFHTRTAAAMAKGVRNLFRGVPTPDGLQPALFGITAGHVS